MLKCLLPMKLTQKISQKHFIISHLLILIVGLIFLGGLYYILNIRYQASSKPFSAGPVTNLPKTLSLNLDHPDDNSLVYQSTTLISGTTIPNEDVLIYTDSQNMVIKSKKDGSFSSTLDLSIGENKVTVMVFDNTGKSKKEERMIYYSKEQL